MLYAVIVAGDFNCDVDKPDEFPESKESIAKDALTGFKMALVEQNTQHLNAAACDADSVMGSIGLLVAVEHGSLTGRRHAHIYLRARA